jgi:hypothetical protein
MKRHHLTLNNECCSKRHVNDPINNPVDYSNLSDTHGMWASNLAINACMHHQFTHQLHSNQCINQGPGKINKILALPRWKPMTSSATRPACKMASPP